ncbi:MAG: type II toxin-antitoxin system HipA family toxin [Acidobacteria bacterium]|nr:type II toxin-antitoxin system HipA family toxin [Acidobacteriota bacterium]
MTTGPGPLAVWAGDSRAGTLTRERRQDYVFAYLPDASLPAQVSLTMPIRLGSWNSRELHPIFQMNLPEGALLDVVRRAIAKLVGEDDLAVLSVTGGNPVGRNRFTAPGADPPTQPRATESLDALLTYPDARELFHELLERYALRSGVSGVQPKVLLDAADRGALASTRFIVKSWGTDTPQLAANEFFCMSAARRARIPTPEFHLSDNGGLFVMRRFDVAPDGAALGFEDMASLQGLGTPDKYRGSYERVARSLTSFVSGEHLPAARETFFAVLVLSVVVRNGDAHLKNFGVLYPIPGGPVAMAPAYDIVTTAAYLRHDVPALTLDGTKRWWPRKALEKFARVHLTLPVKTVRETFQRVADAVSDTRKDLVAYAAEHPDFRAVGDAMLRAWEEGLRELK